MTQQDENLNDEHVASHERVATGALARWMRACATHPWRVVFSWLGIIAVLIVLVATVGGALKDEFTIPGSDTQKATDLIETEFASEQGGVLNLVFAAPEGERLDTPARKAAIAKAIARLESAEFKPAGRQGRPQERRRSVQQDTFSDDGRIAFTEAQFDQTIEESDREAVVAVQEAVRETVEPAGSRWSSTGRRSSRPSSREPRRPSACSPRSSSC